MEEGGRRGGLGDSFLLPPSANFDAMSSFVDIDHNVFFY
jgi:hypothetical protein